MTSLRVFAYSIAVAALALAAGGCGGGAGSNGVAELTRNLSAEQDSYAVVDLAAMREDLGLDEESDPLTAAPSSPLATGAEPALAGLLAGRRAGDANFALGLDQATAVAASEGPDGAVSVIQTDADTGEIGSALGDIGYEERGGVLVRDPGPSFRLDVGLIYAAASPAPLRNLPEEPLDELPDPLLDELDAPLVEVDRSNAGCVLSEGATGEAEGTGEVSLLIDGDAEAERLSAGDVPGVAFGEPDADGDVVSVDAAPADSESAFSGFAAVEALNDGDVSYQC